MPKRYGLLGASPTNTAFAGQAGIYSVDDLFYNKKDGVHPKYYDLTSYFPSAYRTLIDSFDLVAFVSSSDGASYIETLVDAASSSTASAIVILPGTYSGGINFVTATVNTTTAFLDKGKPISYICAPGQTIIEFTRGATERDLCIAMLTNSSSAVYGAYLKRNNNGQTANYGNAWMRASDGTNSNVGTVSNCVFREVNANGNWARNYFAGGYTVQYTTLYVSQNAQNDYNSATGASWDYVVCNYQKGTGTTPWTNSYENQTIESDFQVTGLSTAGVYAGTYAWDANLTTISTSS